MSRKQKSIYRKLICRFFDFIVALDPSLKIKY